MNKNIKNILSYLFSHIDKKEDLIDFLYALSKPIKGLHDYYLMTNVVPSDHYVIEPFNVKKQRNTGILIQGPIISNDEFTLRTIKLYNRIFNEPTIVLSTWEDQNTESFEKLGLNNLIILKNKIVENIGPDNTNKMIVSVRAGIRELRSGNIKYLIRTRTDHRIVMENCEDFLYELLDSYPLDKKGVNNQDSRIITLNFFTLLYIPFHISDMFQFGHINDLEEYWNARLIDKEYAARFIDIDYDKKIMVNEFEKYALSEIYLGIQYAKKIMQHNYNYNYAAYLSFLSDSFIIVDHAMLGIIFYKISGDIFSYSNNEQSKLRKPVSFKDWFLLRSGTVDIHSFCESFHEKLFMERALIDKGVYRV